MYDLKHKSPGLMVILSIVVFLLSSSDCLWASARSKVKQGNRYFNQKKYEKSIERYRDAQIDSPESKEIYFNIGNSLYRTGKHEDAMKEYEKSTYSKDTLLQSEAYYNMGNSLYRQGNMPESIVYYKKALELNPEDEDAKYNIEFVQKKIKEMMDKQKDQPQDQQQKQQKQGEEKEEEKVKKEGDEDKDKEEEQAQKKEDGKKEDEMSEEDAQRILNALEDDEKKAQKERQKAISRQGIRVEQDW